MYFSLYNKFDGNFVKYNLTQHCILNRKDNEKERVKWAGGLNEMLNITINLQKQKLNTN